METFADILIFFNPIRLDSTDKIKWLSLTRRWFENCVEIIWKFCAINLKASPCLAFLFAFLFDDLEIHRILEIFQQSNSQNIFLVINDGILNEKQWFDVFCRKPKAASDSSHVLFILSLIQNST